MEEKRREEERTEGKRREKSNQRKEEKKNEGSEEVGYGPEKGGMGSKRLGKVFKSPWPFRQ